MNEREAYDILKIDYPEISELIVYFSEYETYENCTTNYVLDTYIEYSTSDKLLKLIDSIDQLLQKYLDNQESLNVICEAVTFNYYYYIEFESGAALLNYIRKYVVEKLTTKK